MIFFGLLAFWVWPGLTFTLLCFTSHFTRFIPVEEQVGLSIFYFDWREYGEGTHRTDESREMGGATYLGVAFLLFRYYYRTYNRLSIFSTRLHPYLIMFSETPRKKLEFT